MKEDGSTASFPFSMMLRASVIICAYNAEKTIFPCLQASLRQSFPHDNYEILVIDDGSNDRTGEIASKFPVRYFYQENRGPASARNFGAEKAEGEIILFTDSDCVPDRNWLSEMMRPFQDALVSGVKGAYGNMEKSMFPGLVQLEFEERYDLLEKANGGIDMVDTYSAAFRREIFLKMGGFDTSFSAANNEDTEFSYRLSLSNHLLVFNRKAIVYHTRHSKSFCAYIRLKFGRGYWRTPVYRMFPSKIRKDTYTPLTLKLQVFLVYLFFPSVIATVFYKGVRFLPLGIAVSFILTGIPFFIRVVRENLVWAIVSPFFLLARASALAAGIFSALLAGSFKSKTKQEKSVL